MKNSLKKLLNKFPYFLDKSQNSNLTKSENVFNSRFVEIYNDLFETYLAGKVEKHVLVWKEQETSFDYSIHFNATLEDMDKITLLKNDEVIYIKQFNNSEDRNSFEYIYSSSSENIVRLDKFKIIVETLNENTVTKGFPENDEDVSDEYDHDRSLDEFGEFINLPRKNYIISSDYANTEPPYNASLTEDDYHYMNRILFYLSHIQDTPLPILEIWKIYGIDISNISLINREQLLCKMFDKTKHSNESWIPSNGEHKDLMCAGEDEDVFLFADVNDNTPVQLQNFYFQFKLLNEFGIEIKNKLFYILPFVDGLMLGNVPIFSNETLTLNTTNIDNADAVFQFKAFRTLAEATHEIEINNGIFQEFDGDIISDEIAISTKGCNSGNWYVNPIIGNDTNNGDRDNPFATLNKALSVVEGSKNIIVLSDGLHQVSKTPVINTNTKIICCPNDNPIIKTNTEVFFKIKQEAELYLQGITLQYEEYTTLISDDTFVNKNKTSDFINVVADVIFIIANSDNPILIFEDDSVDIPVMESRNNFTIDITDNDSTADFVIREDGVNPTIIIIEE